MSVEVSVIRAAKRVGYLKNTVKKSEIMCKTRNRLIIKKQAIHKTFHFGRHFGNGGHYKICRLNKYLT